MLTYPLFLNTCICIWYTIAINPSGWIKPSVENGLWLCRSGILPKIQLAYCKQVKASLIFLMYIFKTHWFNLKKKISDAGALYISFLVFPVPTTRYRIIDIYWPEYYFAHHPCKSSLVYTPQVWMRCNICRRFAVQRLGSIIDVEQGIVITMKSMHRKV